MFGGIILILISLWYTFSNMDKVDIKKQFIIGNVIFFIVLFVQFIYISGIDYIYGNISLSYLDYLFLFPAYYDYETSFLIFIHVLSFITVNLSIFVLNYIEKQQGSNIQKQGTNGIYFFIIFFIWFFLGIQIYFYGMT